MLTCTEFSLDDVMAVTAIPLSAVTASEAYQFTPTIAAGDFSPDLTNAIVIGIQPAVEDGWLIPIIRSTGKAKDSETDNTAGRLHTVTVECEIDSRDTDVWALLSVLENASRHLLLTFRDGSQAFVCATEDTYMCMVERDGSKTVVNFRIYNRQGIQLLTDSVTVITNADTIHGLE